MQLDNQRHSMFVKSIFYGHIMKLEDKRIVLTGGTSGIGYELLKLLYPKNEVIVIARNSTKLDELGMQNPSIIPKCCDLANLKELEKLTNEIVTHYGKIDILINNAAVQFTAKFTDDNFDWKTVPREVATNLTAPCCLTYWLLPALTASNSARIVNINSGLALTPKKCSAVYCATKSALDSFTRSLRYQLDESNIGVQQIFFELVDTPMTSGRGRNKLSATSAAKDVIHAIEAEILDHDIGKVKLLRFLLRLAPGFARRILKNN